MDYNSKAVNDLKRFCQEFGVPEKLKFDSSKEQVCKGFKFLKEVFRQGIYHQISKPELHKQNLVEGIIREVRWKW